MALPNRETPPRLLAQNLEDDISERGHLCSYSECKRDPRLVIVFAHREGITKAHYCFEHSALVIRGYPNARITRVYLPPA